MNDFQSEAPTHRFAPRKGEDAPPSPWINLRTKRWWNQSDLIVAGGRFTPGGDVNLLIHGIPGQDNFFNVSWQARDDGSLHFERGYGLVYGDFQDAGAAVFVMARDETTGAIAVDREVGAAGAWIVIVSHS